MVKEELLSLINELYSKDEWIQQLFNASGMQMDKLDELLDEFLFDLYFATCSFEQLKKYEIIAGINAKASQSVDDRRQQLIARWRSDGKSTLKIIQDVAASWNNGECTVTFENGLINLTFDGEYGVPTDLDSLIAAIEEVKPAHLAISYALKYILVSDIAKMTIDTLQMQNISSFAFNERS